MYMVATAALEIGMTIGEDVVHNDQVIIKKGSMVDAIVIKQLQAYRVMGVTIMEPADYASTMLEKIKLSRSFAQFKPDYEANLMAFKVAVDSFVQKRVPFRIDDLKTIVSNLVKDDILGTTLFSYLSLLLVEEERMTYAHGLNVALICKVFSRWFHFNEEETDTLILSGFLYDVGKLMLPNDIIWKPDKLSKMEFDLVKTHAFYGYYMLKKYSRNVSEDVLHATLEHHERIDGSGYPQGLSGDNINKYARIIAILDSYEAMTSARSYRSPKCPYEVVRILSEDGYTKYDATYIKKFLTYIVEELKGNNVRLNDGREGSVIMNNLNDLSRPVISMEDGSICDLSKFREYLYIDAII